MKSLDELLKELYNANRENEGLQVFETKDEVVKVKPDGTIAKTLANGDQLIKTPDGCKKFVSADGLVTTIICETVTCIIKANKGKVFFNSAGTPISEEVFNGIRAGGVAADAQKIGSQITPDGAQVDTFEDGTKVTTNPDGTQTIEAPGQPVITVEVQADGTQIAKTADGKEAMVKDGAVVLKDPDGTVTNIKPDGTVQKVMADGTQIQETATQAVATTAQGDQIVTEVDQETGQQATVSADAQGVVQAQAAQQAEAAQQAAAQMQAAAGMTASAQQQAQAQMAAGAKMNADMSVQMGGATVQSDGTVISQSGGMQTAVNAQGGITQTNMASGAMSQSAISAVSSSMQGGQMVSHMSDGSMTMNMSGGGGGSSSYMMSGGSSSSMMRS